MFSDNKNRNSLFLQKFKNKISQFFHFEFSESLNSGSVNNIRKIDDSTFSKEIQNQQSFNVYKSYNSEILSNLKKLDSNQPVQNSSKRNMSNSPTMNRGSIKTPANRMARATDNVKQQVVSITYEEIGLFPRSFNRVFDRFFKQLFFDVENLVIQEYRFYRYLFLTTVKCVFILLFVPLTINFISKNYLVRPITEYYWNTHQPEIFLNSYQQKRAFTELQDFEEKIYFESLILSSSGQYNHFNLYKPKSSVPVSPEISLEKKEIFQKFDNNEKSLSLVSKNFENSSSSFISELNTSVPTFLNETSFNKLDNQTDNLQISFQLSSSKLQNSYNTELFSESVQNRLHDKILELAIHYNEESIEAITNFFADLISFSSLCYLFFALEIQINITKSFLLEVFFGLDDSKKSLFILFLTDLLVGYHSPNIWELFFSSLFDHYGLPESQTTIFLLVATLPVLLDVLFKYLIFRHLNRASPATVATYHAMIE